MIDKTGNIINQFSSMIYHEEKEKLSNQNKENTQIYPKNENLAKLPQINTNFTEHNKDEDNQVYKKINLDWWVDQGTWTNPVKE